jgi:hypothetical protein
MSAYLKPVVVLLITVLIFAGVYFAANAELMDLIQTRFYNPSVEKSYTKENQIDAEIIQSHILELQSKFSLTLNESPVRNSFLYNQSAQDIFERSRIYGILLETTSGLQYVQFIDRNGIRIHYSTSFRDIISQNQSSTSYRNYTEDANALPIDLVSVPENGRAKFTMDSQGERIIFSFPFFDSMNVYHGTALFTVSVRALSERLVADGRIKVSDSVYVIMSPAGVVLGSPESYKEVIFNQIAAVWKEDAKGGAALQSTVTLDAGDSGTNFTLLSLKTNEGLFFGRLVNSSLFTVSKPMKIIFLLSVFLTFYLFLFFLLNFRPSSVTIVKNRLMRLRDSLFEQLYINKSSQDRARWILELEQRREEIRAELKRHVRMTSRSETIIDANIDRTLDELLAVIKSGSGLQHGQGEVFAVSAAGAVRKAEIQAAAPEEEGIEEVESIEEVPEAGEASIGTVEDAADAIEEFDEIEEIEEIEDIELPAASARKGLLQLASEIARDYQEIYPKKSRKGLLSRASKLASKLADEYAAAHLPAPEQPVISVAPPKRKGKGLLALASEIDSTPVHKGLLAMASEIEFGSDYHAPEDEEEQDFILEMKVVSPHSFMFSDLGSKEE